MPMQEMSLRASAAVPASHRRPAHASRSPPHPRRASRGGKQQLQRRTARLSRSASRPHSANSLVLEEPQTMVEVMDEEDLEDDEEEFEDFEGEDTSGLSAEQVYSLLDVVCEKTEVVQMELKVGDFEMRVQRSLTSSGPGLDSASLNGASVAEPQYPIPPPGTAFVSTYSMDSTALLEPEQPVTVTQSLDEDLEDESTIYLGSPKVGYLRRGRYNKGKRVGKAVMLQAGDKVKKGQVLGYIEQLGTFMPVESPLAGELIAYLVEEGDPVEYRQELVEIAPYFGGHIIGDKKNF